MAYNNGREDRKWRIWKEAEEKVLREHGVDEAPSNKSVLTTGQTLIPTGGFTIGQAISGNTLREWQTGNSQPK